LTAANTIRKKATSNFLLGKVIPFLPIDADEAVAKSERAIQTTQLDLANVMAKGVAKAASTQEKKDCILPDY